MLLQVASLHVYLMLEGVDDKIVTISLRWIG